MKMDSERTTFVKLPHKVICHILRHFLELPSNGELCPNPSIQSRLVTLALVNKKIRSLTASLIRKISYKDNDSAWPALRMFGPHIWDQLEEMEIQVNRSGAIGFLKWLVPSTKLTHLTLIMHGDPYPQPKLESFERVFIGRFFTQIGFQLKTLRIHGINNKSILFATMFQCTVLEELEIGDYGDDGGSTLINAAMLLCSVNRSHLRYVNIPLKAWKARTDVIPNGQQFASGCEILWKTLFGSYKAGMKESVVNLKSDEEELVKKFKTVSLRMDRLEEDMNETLQNLKVVAKDIPEDEIPFKVFKNFLPSINSNGAIMLQ